MKKIHSTGREKCPHCQTLLIYDSKKSASSKYKYTNFHCQVCGVRVRIENMSKEEYMDMLDRYTMSKTEKEAFARLRGARS